MLEISNYEDIKFHEPINSANIRQLIEKMLGDDFLRLIDPAQLITYVAPVTNADFCIHGKVRVFHPIIMKPEIMKQLLYIQNVGILDMQSDYYTRRSDINSYLMLYTCGGQGEILCGNKSYLLTPDSCCLVDCHQKHFYRTIGKHWDHVALHFTGKSAHLLTKDLLKNGIFYFKKEDYKYIKSIVERLCTQYATVSASRALIINYLLTKLLTDLTMLQSPVTDFSENSTYIYNTIEYMKKNLDKPLTLSKLASRQNLSKYHFSRLFHQCTGFAPIEYLINLRIEHAKALLIITDLSIKEIALRVGYPNEQYFSKLFHKKTGVSPRRWR